MGGGGGTRPPGTRGGVANTVPPYLVMFLLLPILFIGLEKEEEVLRMLYPTLLSHASFLSFHPSLGRSKDSASKKVSPDNRQPEVTASVTFTNGLALNGDSKKETARELRVEHRLSYGVLPKILHEEQVLRILLVGNNFQASHFPAGSKVGGGFCSDKPRKWHAPMQVQPRLQTLGKDFKVRLVMSCGEAACALPLCRNSNSTIKEQLAGCKHNGGKDGVVVRWGCCTYFWDCVAFFDSSKRVKINEVSKGKEEEEWETWFIMVRNRWSALILNATNPFNSQTLWMFTKKSQPHEFYMFVPKNAYLGSQPKNLTVHKSKLSEWRQEKGNVLLMAEKQALVFTPYMKISKSPKGIQTTAFYSTALYWHPAEVQDEYRAMYKLISKAKY